MSDEIMIMPDTQIIGELRTLAKSLKDGNQTIAASVCADAASRLAAYLAIAPQAPVSAGWATGLKSHIGHSLENDCWFVRVYPFKDEFEAVSAKAAILSALASPPPPAQADDGKDAEIDHLRSRKKEAEAAVEFATDALERKNAIIRELVAALKDIETARVVIDGKTNVPASRFELMRWAEDALAKAKAAGYAP